MIKSTLKIARYCALVIQGFSNFLGLFQVIMANPDIRSFSGYFQGVNRHLLHLNSIQLGSLTSIFVQHVDELSEGAGFSMIVQTL